MLGIDIVDLNDPRFKERDTRSLKLILCENDRVIDHEHIFWLLWAAKEAVFKCHREAFNFSPTSIPIHFFSKYDEIRFSSGQIEGNVQITKDYILAICSDDPQSLSYEIVNLENEINGDQLRASILDFFSKKGKDFQLGSDDLNLPVLLPSQEPISISHHGKFGAFAYPQYLLNV